MSEIVATTMEEMLPDAGETGVRLEALHAAVTARVPGWVALIRMASLVPFALLDLVMLVVGFGIGVGMMDELLRH